jgi:hypothetical protein
VTLHLAGSAEAGKGPTFEELIALTRKLSGREPTTEEVATAREVYESIPRD